MYKPPTNQINNTWPLIRLLAMIARVVYIDVYINYISIRKVEQDHHILNHDSDK